MSTHAEDTSRRASNAKPQLLLRLQSLQRKKSQSFTDLKFKVGNAEHKVQPRVEVRWISKMYRRSNSSQELVHKAPDDEEQLSEGNLLNEVLDISNVLADGGSSIIDDSFLRCFTSSPQENWNWNLCSFPLWLCGVVVRYCLLFPIRLSLLMIGFLIFFILFFPIRVILPDCPKKRRFERALIQVQCRAFVAAITRITRFHGPKPVAAKNHIWVANHTSMIDYAILCSYTPFAVTMSLYRGWVKFIQTSILNCLGCIWFNRTEVKDRKIVSERMKKHVSAKDSTPLLIFPEGTCVNNEYIVLFKRGAFDLDCTVCPIAIKYNKIFVDAFWNSKQESYTRYVLKLMTSWGVVCDVYFLEPQVQKPQETATEFASRVQGLIAKQAQLHPVQWDGYLKFYNLGQKNPHLIEKQRQDNAKSLRSYLKGRNNK